VEQQTPIAQNLESLADSCRVPLFTGLSPSLRLDLAVGRLSLGGYLAGHDDIYVADGPNAERGEVFLPAQGFAGGSLFVGRIFNVQAGASKVGINGCITEILVMDLNDTLPI
jgi:hypothetical protein